MVMSIIENPTTTATAASAARLKLTEPNPNKTWVIHCVQVRYIGPSDPDNLAGPLLSQEICEVVGAAKIDGAHVLIRCRSREISSNVRLTDLELAPAALAVLRWAERVESTLSRLVSIHNDKSAVGTRWSDIASEFVLLYVGRAQC